MPPGFVLALDQGTTGSTALVVDPEGSVRARGYAEVPQHYPRPGWVEHDPEELWTTLERAATQALKAAGLHGTDVGAIGITNQRGTTIVWDRAPSARTHRAIVWRCCRTASACDRLRAQGQAPAVRQRTGLVLDAYFSATKIAWLLNYVPDARRRAARGQLAFGTVDSWLLWKLTRGRVHATDVSNASRTLCLNLATVDWDDAMCALLDVPREVLPQIVDSSGPCGETADVGWLPRGVPIAGIAGDQQAALFGQACFEPGAAKNTYGTGCFALVNTGERPVVSSHGLLTTIAWRIRGRTTYALEGAVFVAGAAVQWLRDGLAIIANAAETDALARSVPDTGGVAFVPAFVGLGAPYWDQHARGTIIGITRGTTRAHVVRAALEAIAFQSRDVLDAMAADAKSSVGRLRVDGGAVANDFLCQFQADMLDAPVDRPAIIETTALGAAYLAGLGAGLWQSPDAVAERHAVERTFRPAIPAGTPIAYGRIVEWKGKPEVDIFWGGESALFEKLAEQKLLQKVELSREAWESIPASIGKPKPIPLKDPEGYWIGTALEPYGLVYHPKKIQRLGIAEPKDWDDLLHPKLKGEVAQCAPTRSSSSNATYEVILSMLGEDKGWEWLRRLASNTGHFTARSRDVPTVVAKGEYTAGFAVPSYMAFEEKLAGFDLKFVAPKNAFVTPEPMAILAGSRNPKAAKAFVEFLLTERGQKVFMERGLFPITPKYKVRGTPGSTAEMAVEFTGGVRSYFDREISNVYDEAVAAKRSEALKAKFRSDIEATWKKP